MFEEIIGHKEQIKMLKKALEVNNISHAYLFVGNKGIGKCKVAFEFAKEILKTDSLYNSPDFKYICKSEDKRDIVIEQIRKDIIDDVYIAPAASEKKVYIIDDAESLNVAAQNALLKTLEEPPRHVVIILIAQNVNTFLNTILSRVNTITFNSIPKDVFKKYVKDNLKADLSDNIVDFLDGSLGLAIDLINDNKLNELKDVDGLYNYLVKKDEISSMINSFKINFSNFINLEYLEYLLYLNGKYFCVKFVEKARNRLKNNGNYDIVIDNMVLKIIDHI